MLKIEFPTKEELQEVQNNDSEFLSDREI